MTTKLTSKGGTTEQVFYPETDGRPMAESDLHRDIMFYIIHLLQRFFAGQRVYVSGNLLLYYEEGNPRKSVAPDCFVVWDVEPHRRNIYKLWEEGQAPKVVFEVTSRSTQREDHGRKMRLYAQLGVEEYYLYDPTAEYMDPPLAGFQLVGGGYVPMEPLNEELMLSEMTYLPDRWTEREYASPLLSLRLALNEDNLLQFFDMSTGQRLLTDDEARQQAEMERQQAEMERRQAEMERRQAEERAAEAEAENARLREELARLRQQAS